MGYGSLGISGAACAHSAFVHGAPLGPDEPQLGLPQSFFAVTAPYQGSGYTQAGWHACLCSVN